MRLNDYVIPLESAGGRDAARVGGKAAALGTMLEAGFAVPPGLCVTTAAFRLALEPWWADVGAAVEAHDLPFQERRAIRRGEEQIGTVTLRARKHSRMIRAIEQYEQGEVGKRRCGLDESTAGRDFDPALKIWIQPGG